MRVLVLLFVATVANAADISAGSHMLPRLLNPMSTRSTHLGDPTYFAVMTPISDGNTIVVPAGSYVQGVVVEVERAGRIKGKSGMRILLDTLTLPSGKQVQINPRVASLDASGHRVIDEEGLIQTSSNPKPGPLRVTCTLAHIGRVGHLGGGLAAIGSNSPRTRWIGMQAGDSVGAVATLLQRGRDVELPKGTDLDIVFDFPVELQ